MFLPLFVCNNQPGRGGGAHIDSCCSYIADWQNTGRVPGVQTESIELFLDDHAFLAVLRFGSFPTPTLPPLPLVPAPHRKTEGGGGEMGEETNHTAERKPDPL
jgi:hypothetical protein